MLFLMEGTPPLMAHSPRETSTSHCLRNCSSTWTFSSLQQPPSTIPTAQRPWNSLKSLIGDRSNSTRSASCRIRSSMSRMDMWHPKQPARLTVAMRVLVVILFLSRRFDVPADGNLVIGSPPHRHRIADALLQQGPDRARGDRFVRSPQVGHRKRLSVDLKPLVASAFDELEDVLVVQVLGSADAPPAQDAPVVVEVDVRVRHVDVALRVEELVPGRRDPETVCERLQLAVAALLAVHAEM